MDLSLTEIDSGPETDSEEDSNSDMEIVLTLSLPGALPRLPVLVQLVVVQPMSCVRSIFINPHSVSNDTQSYY